MVSKTGNVYLNYVNESTEPIKYENNITKYINVKITNLEIKFDFKIISISKR